MAVANEVSISPTNAVNINKIPTKQLKFSHLSNEDGLSSSNVFAINQDKLGYLWLATEDGLNRFDGTNIQSYRHNASNPNSISHNVIRKIYIDHSDTVWVGTQNGLNRYNRELDNFDTFYHVKEDNNSIKDNIIWDIYQDKSNLLWISTASGLQTLNLTSKKVLFNPVSIANLAKDITEVKTIFEDNQGNFWFGSFDSGIHLVDQNLVSIGSLGSKNKHKLKINASTLFDIKFIDKQYWLATNNGVYIVSEQLELKTHLSTQQGLLSNHIRSVEQYNKTHVWLATSKGLNIINLTNNHISAQQNSSNSSSLSENWLMDIFKDKNSTMWLASYGGGVNKYSPLTAKLNHELAFDNRNYRVEFFTETSDGTIYFSTEQQGLFQLVNDIITQVRINLSENISQVISEQKDLLWLLTKSGKLFQYSLSKKQLDEHINWYQKYNHDDNGYQFVTLINDDLWFINKAGELVQYKIKKQQFTHHYNAKNSQFTHLQKDPSGSIWLISDKNKVHQFNTSSNTFVRESFDIVSHFNSEQITSIAISNDVIWLGSDSQGVLSIDKKSKQNYIYDESNGLRNNYIASILIDNNNNAWLASNKSISYIDTITKKILHFDEDFSLNNPEFNDNASLKSSTGRFFFGSPQGFYHFNPIELLQIKQKIAKPVFTNLYIANKNIAIKKSSEQRQAKIAERKAQHNMYQPEQDKRDTKFTLNKQLNSLTKLTLQHKHFPISFEFVSPNVKLPSQLRYRYRLEGIDPSWIEVLPESNKAIYSSIQPGSYLFTVQAYDIHQPSMTKQNSIAVEILPPWWRTNKAIALYVFISFLLLCFILQQMNNRRRYHLRIKLNEERLKLSLWGSGDEMWDWNLTSGKIYRSNIWESLDFPQDGSRNSVNKHTKEKQSNIHPQDIARVKQTLHEHFSGESEHYEAAYRVKDKKGRWIWILDRGKIVERNEEQQPTRMTGTLKDISQIKETEERLKLFAKCIENISDAVVIYNREFLIVDINKAYTRITSKERDQVLGKTLNFSQYPISFTETIKEQLTSKGYWHGEIESKHKHKNNQKYYTDLNLDVIYDENGNISHFVGVFSDITKRKSTEVELRKLANSDTLTGLPNRTLFQANQSKLVKNKIHHALLVFDLDNFKKINDSLGHQIGDAILCNIAERMLNIGRKQDNVYRLGGDEFSVLIENTNDIGTITKIANEILTNLATPFSFNNQELVLYGSIGIVLYPDDGIGPHELLKNADTAMYHAKDSGGNKYQFFSDSMNKEAVKRLEIENLVRHGLKNDSFTVFYQPKIAISSGKMAGMEALVRLDIPSKGIIRPDIFIPISEETGQIIDIGEVVLRKACFATKKWVDEGLFTGRVAVNLSAVQFTQANLVTVITNILNESGLSPQYLELEITEGTVMNTPQQAIETMQKISAMGIHLSLDDFGTGYSSLAYLKKFPLNTLKIDKAFVDDIELSEQGRNMVATIVTIAHNLDMQVVAEGVETRFQLNFLASLGCEQFQGYLYSKPLENRKFKELLLSQ